MVGKIFGIKKARPLKKSLTHHDRKRKIDHSLGLGIVGLIGRNRRKEKSW